MSNQIATWYQGIKVEAEKLGSEALTEIKKIEVALLPWELAAFNFLKPIFQQAEAEIKAGLLTDISNAYPAILATLITNPAAAEGEAIAFVVSEAPKIGKEAQDVFKAVIMAQAKTSLPQTISAPAAISTAGSVSSGATS